MKRILHFFIPLALFALIISSCEDESDYSLSQTIFIQDPYYPGLPVYSEWGYNTFGAYIDRKPFVSTNNDLPVKILVNTDTLHIILRGLMNGSPTDLKLSMKGFSPQTYVDLTKLNDTIINLKEIGRKAELTYGGTTTKLDLIEGEIEFKRVQNLYVDEELTRTIISGYFQMKTFLNDEPIAISHGRFDFGIGYENFYNY